VKAVVLTLQMKRGLIFCFLLIAAKCFSQDKTVDGIVIDKESKDRIATVIVHNITAGTSVFNNLKGEFTIAAQTGDVLVFSRAEYHSDTLKVQNNFHLAVYMAPLAIRLREVTVRDTVLTPAKRLAATKQEFGKAYGSLAYGDLLSTSPGSGAGLCIDAIFNSLSRSGRNAARLREIIQGDYEQNAIDFRFNRTYVGKITGLKDDKLTAFMRRYRPGYYTVTTANEYEFVTMIRNNLRRFTRNQRLYTLPELVTPPVLNN